MNNLNIVCNALELDTCKAYRDAINALKAKDHRIDQDLPKSKAKKAEMRVYLEAVLQDFKKSAKDNHPGDTEDLTTEIPLGLLLPDSDMGMQVLKLTYGGTPFWSLVCELGNLYTVTDASIAASRAIDFLGENLTNYLTERAEPLGLLGHLYDLGDILLYCELASEFEGMSGDDPVVASLCPGMQTEICSFYEGLLLEYHIDRHRHSCIHTAWFMLSPYIKKYGLECIIGSLEDNPCAWHSEILGYIGHGVSLSDHGPLICGSTGQTIERLGGGSDELHWLDRDSIYACAEALLKSCRENAE